MVLVVLKAISNSFYNKIFWPDEENPRNDHPSESSKKKVIHPNVGKSFYDFRALVLKSDDRRIRRTSYDHNGN